MSSTTTTSDDLPPPYTSIIQPITSIQSTPMDPNLTMELSYMTKGEDQTLLVKVVPTAGTQRTPLHICCVVDISGSMGEEATFQVESGKRESDGLTILDLVKHSIKTIISTMTQGDLLSIVSFSTNARVDFEPTAMDTSGKSAAVKKIESLFPENSTNLWAGLELGWKTVLENKTSSQGKVHSVFLFTDGMPNVIPPRGHIPMIQGFMDKHAGGAPPCSVNTFGFGYSLDSPLLDEIARIADGSFVFIPDSSFVGTAFINATANMYTTLAENVNIRVLLPEKSQESMKLKVTGGHQVTDTNWGKVIRVGNVHFDQPREFVIHLKNTNLGSKEEYFTLFLDYSVISPSTTKQPQIEALVKGSDWEDNTPFPAPILRYQFVDGVEEYLKNAAGVDASIDLGPIINSLEYSDELPENPFITALMEDVNGQVTLALQLDFFARWGKHYLLSLAGAHRAQLCSNFKDPGLQLYGGPLFEALRANFDETFNELPAPKPSRKGTRGNAPVNMRLYNSRAGPCFHGDCSVMLTDGKEKLVRDVIKGEEVTTQDGSVATVLCVLNTPFPPGSTAELVEFPGGLRITPYHPILNGEWKFPIDVKEAEVRKVPTDAIFSFVLDSGHSVIINGVACVTLGHGAKGDVREHPYFGTDAVLNDMKATGGWEKGLVFGGEVTRDKVSGLVDGIHVSMSNQA